MKIKAFKGMEPNQTWYNSLMNQPKDRDRLQQQLENTNNAQFTTCKSNLEKLLENQHYIQDDKPGIYIYENITAEGSRFGVWVLTSLQDNIDQHIVTHEHTLSAQQGQMQSYREHFGLEASPIIVTYRRHPPINRLIEKVAAFPPTVSLTESDSNHKVWKISDVQTIAAFQQAFTSIDRVYLADGHHRLAAAASLHQYTPQWISTLYVSAGQVRCKEFHRLVLPKTPVDEQALFSHLETFFYHSIVPNKAAYKPSQAKCFGMKYKNQWHQLNLKEVALLKEVTDVQLLQSMVLEPFFKISNPGNDPSLKYFQADQWEELLLQTTAQPEAIAFSLYPIGVEELIGLAEKGEILPPKSTYIEPKVPFGLLLYQNETTLKTQEETTI